MDQLGSTSCLYGVYCKGAHPKLGPLLYLTKSTAENTKEKHGTMFHFDGEGELDAAHIVLKGKNRVTLFERTKPNHNTKLEEFLKCNDWHGKVEYLKKEG